MTHDPTHDAETDAIVAGLEKAGPVAFSTNPRTPVTAGVDDPRRIDRDSRRRSPAELQRL